MSEHYIQSQYLIKQITQDFFKEDSSNIRMKDTKYVFDDNDENSIDSDDNIQEVNLDEHDNDEYHYLEDKEDLNYIFDLCDNEPDILKEYKIHICCYKINDLCVLPFIQYFLVENDDGKLHFPMFEFKCATNITIDEDEEFSPKHVFFQNECMKFLLKYAKPLEENNDEDLMKNIYKGFVTSKTNDNSLYVILNCNELEFEKDTFGTIDELLNKHSISNKTIEPEAYQLFYNSPELMQIKNKWGTMMQTPQVLYQCTFEDNKYENVLDNSEEMISIIDDRIEHPLLGNSFIFSSEPVNSDNAESLKRSVVFIKKPIYLMKDLSTLEKVEEGYTLGSIIPSVVDYMKP